MLLLKILLLLIPILLLLWIIAALVCYLMIFYSPKRKEKEEYPIPDGEIYEEYREDMVNWIKEARARPQTPVSIRSFDGLVLRGTYYEYAEYAPIEILFHGYKGTGERDMSGGIARCFAIGHSALVVDHRASGNSDGRTITFGVYESRDCRSWVDFVLKEIDPDAQIILTGISMGAATVMIAAAMELPRNVVGILADCGYTSAREIIRKVMRDMHLPDKLLYPIARSGARMFGGFDPDAVSPIEAMKHARVPVIFFHGDTDDFVPHAMSVQNYEACIQKKRLVTVRNAGHGLCFPAERELYLSELHAFFDPITSLPR